MHYADTDEEMVGLDHQPASALWGLSLTQVGDLGPTIRQGH